MSSPAVFLFLDGVATAWSEAMLRACWQGGLALGLAWLLTRALPVLTPAARCWLWRLAYAKLLLSFLCATPLDLPLLPASPSVERPVVERGAWSVGAQSGRAGERLVVERGAGSGKRAEHRTPSTERRTPHAQRLTLDAPTPHSPILPLFLLWLAGVAVNGVLFFRSWGRSKGPRTALWTDAGPEVRQACEELAAVLAVRKLPRLVVAADASTPMLTGLLHPTIVLPPAAGSAGDELWLILAHELAHLKRSDLLWGVLPALARLFFYFHPLVWLGRREWTLAHEIACDELALACTRAPACDYGALLLRVAAGSSRGDTLFGVSAAGSYSTLERRLSAMKSFGRTPGRHTPVLAAAVLALGCAALPPWRVVAQSDVTPRPRTPQAAGAAPAADRVRESNRTAAGSKPERETPDRQKEGKGSPDLSPGESPESVAERGRETDAERDRARSEERARREAAASKRQAERELRAAEARVRAAEARLKAAAGAEEKAAAARDEMELAKRRLEELQGDLEREQRRAAEGEAAVKAARAVREAEVAAAEAAHEAARVRLERLESLFKTGHVSAAALEEARAAVAQARANLQAAVARLRQAADSSEVARALREQQAQAARARLEAAEVQRKRAGDLARAGYATRKQLLEARSALEAARLDLAQNGFRRRELLRERSGDGAPVVALGPLGEARLRAARSRYEIGVKLLQEGGGRDLEDLYLWSHRWLEAEVSVAPDRGPSVQAHEQHLARMKELQKIVRAQVDAGRLTAADAAAADYYVAEAEIQLRQSHSP